MPLMTMSFVPKPEISAPNLVKNLPKLTTCGSLAAFLMVVVAGWPAAIMRAFSVAVTEASSRKMFTSPWTGL